MKPQRIQLKREKGWRMPPNTVKVDRTSRMFGNPFRVGHPPPNIYRHADFDYADTERYPFGEPVKDAAEAVRLFTKYALPNKSLTKHLAGKNLACWCKVGEACHADVLLQIANP